MKMPPLTCQRGMALVTSLIMLGLVTLLAIAFIGLSRRERHSVEVTKKTTEAKMMADASLARAQVEVMERLRNNINLQLLVSTNSVPLSPTIDPRPTVIYTVNAQPDDRFFLNLNRDFNVNGLPQFQDTIGANVGDPQWIGVLEDPTASHSADNRFTGRYAYMVVPASKATGLEWMNSTDHAAAMFHQLDRSAVPSASRVNWPYDHYYRSGPWTARSGLAFNDATVWLANRSRLLEPNADVFNPSAIKVGANFVGRLTNAAVVDPYTFYKLAGSFSPDGGIADKCLLPVPPYITNKFNLNNTGLAPAVYFKEVADRLLKASIVSSVSGGVTSYYVGTVLPGNEIGSSASGFNPANFTSANISIYPVNQYKPEVHRLLQLAANLYEMVNPELPSSHTAPNGTVYLIQFPSVFRPTFQADNTGRVYISGYVSELSNAFLGYRTLNLPADLNSVNLYSNSSLMGMIAYPTGEVADLPLIIGTRKLGPVGTTFARYQFPNFNELIHQIVFTSDFSPPSPPSTPARAVMAVNARVWVETWNSTWSTALANAQLPFQLAVTCDLRGLVDDQTSVKPINFSLPLSTVFTNQTEFLPRLFDFLIWGQTNIGLGANARPRLTLQLTNRVSYALSFQGRLVDHVNLFGIQSYGPRTMPANNRDLEERAWQVNDPLVNSWSRDLVQINYNDRNSSKTAPVPFPPNISAANQSSKPWSGNALEIGFKDVGASSAFLWNFPAGPLGNIGQIGQVHRGTPWQSVYFKSWPPGVAWPFSPDSHPINDWRLPDLFTVAAGAAITGLPSVNNTSEATWAAVLSGVPMRTQPEDWITPGTRDYVLFDLRLSQPAGYDWNLNPPPNNNFYQLFRQDRLNTYAVGGNTSQVASDGAGGFTLNFTKTGYRYYDYAVTPPALRSYPNPTNVVVAVPAPSPFIFRRDLITLLAQTINAQRNTAMGNGKPFALTGQVLGTPELTMAFPFSWNWSNDSDYERIPLQLLSRLRVEDEPIVVVYAWGQSLKPADKSIITSGVNVGLVGNYVVTGQVGTRTVLRIKNFNPAIRNQPPRMVVESFKVLP